jgi:hypothetical protein
VFSEGESLFSAFGVSAFGKEAIDTVGSWLETVFVPVVIPRILEEVNTCLNFDPAESILHVWTKTIH